MLLEQVGIRAERLCPGCVVAVDEEIQVANFYPFLNGRGTRGTGRTAEP
jgi:hypothetical protein